MTSRTTTEWIKKSYPSNTKGIIRIYDYPIIVKYGTFSEFLKIVKKEQDDGVLGKAAYIGYRDGNEKKINGIYHGWTDHWITYKTKERYPRIALEFHTVSHYNDGTGKAVFEKPTAKNDKFFSDYSRWL